ncbi:MAG: SufE family protein [Simkaniaceae bacterium]|nr:SufE family protein [Simkaniaceae bacterium]
MEFSRCLDKQKKIKKHFLSLTSQEERYQKIIELGQNAPKMATEDQVEENLVAGCQSLLYLKIRCQKGKLSLQTSSNALISAGLAQLLVQIYNGESPEAIFTHPPHFFKEIGLLESLSPSRANGLKSLYQKLQKESLKFLVSK